jgi:hypothetical protein
MSDEQIEADRQHKMATLVEAREHYRRLAARCSRQLAGTHSKGQLRSLQMALRVADADLRLFNKKHPRQEVRRSVSSRG